jgi:hypothetical protein
MADQSDYLPPDFAKALQELYRSGDPRLAASLIAANRAGWSRYALGTALGVTGGSITRYMEVGPEGHEPIVDFPPGPLPQHQRLPPADDPGLLARQAAARKARDEKRRKAAVRQARSEEIYAERHAEAEYRELCQRLAIKPIKKKAPAGQRWYECMRCKTPILRSATRPDAHSYPPCNDKAWK